MAKFTNEIAYQYPMIIFGRSITKGILEKWQHNQRYFGGLEMIYVANVVESDLDTPKSNPHVKNVMELASNLQSGICALAIVDKKRHGHSVAEVMNQIGDVKGKVAVMVDDMTETAYAQKDRSLSSIAEILLRGNWIEAAATCCTIRSESISRVVLRNIEHLQGNESSSSIRQKLVDRFKHALEEGGKAVRASNISSLGGRFSQSLGRQRTEVHSLGSFCQQLSDFLTECPDHTKIIAVSLFRDDEIWKWEVGVQMGKCQRKLFVLTVAECPNPEEKEEPLPHGFRLPANILLQKMIS
ncbi:hypothetical protein CTI12_AA472740 [Artemisia annua]|uniref:Uncharacterized protein n=1 Tax=Artemisia annua TaxID=35608 RepID=A0A2U1LMB0_ARTAN|nr:hypothetical protein CTI12_AA472740 [Artemisia annua]